MSGIIAADLEGTLTAGETWRGIGDYLYGHGRRNEYSFFLARHLPGVFLLKAGLKSRAKFSAMWVTDLLRLFKGKTEAEFREMVEWVLEHETWKDRRQAVIDDIRTLQDQGHQLVIVSGAYQIVVEAFAERLGAVQAIGTPLEIVEGKLTGRLAAPVNMGDYKVQHLREYLGGRPLVAAYGDTAPDVAMLSLSQNPVAVHPDEGLRAAAEAKGWRILED